MKTKSNLKNKKVNEKFVCPKCNSSYTYTLKDGTLICRRCSYRKKK